MVLILLVLLLILAIAYFQIAQGLFSALIMAILTLLCAATAFNYYRPLACLLYPYQPAYADAIALIALFVIPLLILRIAIDWLLPRNVTLGVWPNRIAAGLVGLLVGTIMVGVLTIALQMLPVGGTILTYEPFDKALQRDQRLAPFYPDEFTLALMGRLSDGSLRGQASFATDHDDLLRALFCARNTAGAGGRIDAYPDQLKVLGAYSPPLSQPWRSSVPAYPLITQPDTKVVVVRTAVSEFTREPAEFENPDLPAEDWYFLPATHFRLVSPDGRSFWPVGYLWFDPDQADPADQWNLHAAPAEKDQPPQIADLLVARNLDATPPADGDRWLIIDWVYRLPADVPLDGEPGLAGQWHVIFRRIPQAVIPPARQDAMPPPDGALGPEPERKRSERLRPPRHW